MSDKLDKLIEKDAHNFNDYIKKINDYRNIIGNRDVLDSDEIWKVTIGCVNAFSKIAELCFSYGNFKDNWEYETFYQNLYGPQLIIESKKTKCNYYIGLDLEGIYLSTDLRFNQNLRYMDDKFWNNLIDLTQFEGFKYSETEFTPDNYRKKYPDLFKTNKSIVFRIMRKYFFNQITDYDNSDSCSVGEFKILMGTDYKFDYVLKKYCLAFKMMYQLNYELWKAGDLKRKALR